MEWFKKAGISGGWIDEAADQIVARINSGQPGLKDSWDKVIAQWKEESAKLAVRLKEPIKSNFAGNPLEVEAEPGKVGRMHDHGDALIRVGNFLGSSRDAMENIARKQVDLLQQIANNFPMS
jgi:hypothetical protein